MEHGREDTYSFSGSDIATLLGSNYFPVVCEENVFGEKFAAECEREIRFLLTRQDTFTSPAMGRGDNKWENPIYRSDRTCWITPDFCETEKMPHVAQLVHRMIKLSSSVRKQSGRDDILNSYSVQLAFYAGGTSGYTRHLDSFASLDKDGTRRQLTMIFYLNSRWEGGQLRLFVSPEHQEAMGCSHVDIDPSLGRLIAFPSEAVEHEVLPSAQDRLAITLWVSGRGSLLQDTLSTIQPIEDIPQDIARGVVSKPLLTHTPEPVDGSGFTANALLDSSSFSLTPADAARHAFASIFVSIASYRDSELKHTLSSLFHQADFPDRVYVGVVLQIDPSDDAAVYGLGEGSAAANSALIAWLRANVRVCHMSATSARGPCFARSLCGALWSGEQYFLQIDAHMRFRRSWDTYLLDQFEIACEILRLDSPVREYSSGSVMDGVEGPEVYFPVITTYPPGYTLKTSSEGNSCVDPAEAPSDIRPTVVVASHFDSDGMLRQKGRLLRCLYNQPIPSALWAAGFSFTSSRAMVQLAPYDSMLAHLFFGEEMSMAARLFTSGARFFAPAQTVVYHLWSRRHRPPPICSSDEERTGPSVQPERKRLSQHRVRKLLGIPEPSKSTTTSTTVENLVDTSIRGMGKVCSVSDFAESAGISLLDCTVSSASAAGCFHDETVFADDFGDALSAENSRTQQLDPKLAVLQIVQTFMRSKT